MSSCCGAGRRSRTWSAPSTLDQIWTRHIADSAQLLALAPEPGLGRLGSGAGFPGLVIAILLRGTAGCASRISIESNARKCAFLREVGARRGAPADVHNGRDRGCAAARSKIVDVVTARALAPLPTLLELGKIAVEQRRFGAVPQKRG